MTVATHATLAFPPRHYLNDEYGIWSWLLTVDHKRIAHPLHVLDHAVLLRRRRGGRR